MHKPCLFLDIGGVLNSSTFFRCRGPEFPRQGVEYLARQFDPHNVSCLNIIINAVDPLVIISSSWRLLRSLKQINQALWVAGFDGIAIGVTPVPPYYPHRGAEIHAWIDQAQVCDASDIVILDDEADMGPLTSRLVQTDPEKGLTCEDAQDAIEMFNSR